MSELVKGTRAKGPLMDLGFRIWDLVRIMLNGEWNKRTITIIDVLRNIFVKDKARKFE